ncbi:TetR/AcrR family transcriptional regulator [Desulforhopalus singaporensis]|uniref:Transcriptional regulator, TetR family n=1 Tax=Desulforhopalus singaporensis TaxID=91360 RepID=A0A1H0T180_9BACT|nr:TetR/AcrR family transcriptional regulator [Desulforhopalus singaporensis]SDP47704.1 transcriptional regulator, TetR family [Desulforhopalus singaporensis]
MAETVVLKGLATEEKKVLILDACLRSLAQHGYGKTTLDIIAQEVGVSKGTLSYYFNNKEELIAASIEHSGNSILETFKEAIANYDEPQQKINVGLNILFDFFYNDFAYINVYYDLLAQGLYSERLRQPLKNVTKRFRDIFLELLMDGDSAKAVNDKSNTMMKAAMLACLVDGIVKQIVIDSEAFRGVDVRKGMENIFNKICETI